jgi:type IV secretory pathway TrbL component
MTETEIQEEAGILALACAQLGNELAQGRIQAAEGVHKRLGAILKKLAALEEMAAKPNGHAEPEIRAN